MPFIESALDYLHNTRRIQRLIVGRTSGLDTHTEAWAEQRGIPATPFPADWAKVDRPGAVVRKRRNARSTTLRLAANATSA